MTCPDCSKPDCDGCGPFAKIDHVIAVRKAASPVYGCHNRPRPTAATSYPAQDGWQDIGLLTRRPSRLPIIVPIGHTMSTNCRYDLSAADQRCAGCVHGSRP